MASNKDVKNAVEEIKSKVSEASSESDLLTILDEIINLNFPLKYNNTLQWFLGSFCIAIAVIYFIYIANLRYVTELEIYPPVVIGFIGFMCFGYGASRTKSVKSLSDTIFLKTLCLTIKYSKKKSMASNTPKALSNTFLSLIEVTIQEILSTLSQGTTREMNTSLTLKATVSIT